MNITNVTFRGAYAHGHAPLTSLLVGILHVRKHFRLCTSEKQWLTLEYSEKGSEAFQGVLLTMTPEVPTQWRG